MRLSIRPEQMSVVEAVAQENFVSRIAAHLLADYSKTVVILPDESRSAVEDLPEETLHSLVRTGIARARGHGLGLESSIAAFVAVMFEVAPNFDTHRLCEVLLADEEVEPDRRLDELLKVLTEKNWKSVKESYDPQAWQPAEENVDDGKTQEKDEPSSGNGEPDESDFLQTVKM